VRSICCYQIATTQNQQQHSNVTSTDSFQSVLHSRQWLLEGFWAARCLRFNWLLQSTNRFSTHTHTHTQ